MNRRTQVASGVLLCAALNGGTATTPGSQVSTAAVPVDPASIPASDYVQVDSVGHLAVQGKRIRFWGAIGGLPCSFPDFKSTDTPEQKRAKVKAAYADADALVQRLVDLGFNLNRAWHLPSVDEDYTLGDGSRADITDYFFATMKRRGLHLWAAGINHFGKITPDDAGVIDDTASAREWQAALKKWNNGSVDVWNIARKWDPRFEALSIKRRADIATHLNRHTGLRYCDDPVFAAWELSNEEWWMSKMVAGEWRRLPDYWQKMLSSRWTAFLKQRYGTDAALKQRWKALLPGESLARGTVQLLPGARPQDFSTFAMDEQAKKQLVAAQVKTDKAYSRADFSRERGEDVMAFFVDLHVSSKRREAVAFKALGRSTTLCPLAWDTGIGYEIQSQYLHQNADVTVHDAYVNGWGWTDEQKTPPAADEMSRCLDSLNAEGVAANIGPWNNWLLKRPGIYQGVPWLEHNKTPGKPFLAYETQIQQPAKYRADYPLRIAALASIQDWDGICWHYFAPPGDIAAHPENWVQAMDNTVGSHPQGYHFTYDEVQTAQMRAAAFMWRNELLKPAPNPTTFIFGRSSLYDPASMDYARSYGRKGLDMALTTYQYGVRLLIDTSRADDEVRGPVVGFDARNERALYTPTGEIAFDTKKGVIVFDAPGAVAFTGFIPRMGGMYAFANGIELSAIDISNPPGIYDPVTNSEGYIAFSLYSEDGKSLATCKSAALALSSTSFNTGFSLSKDDFRKAGALDHPLAKTATDTRVNGSLPVLVARVAGTVKGKAIAGMKYTMYDWTMKKIGSGSVVNGELRVPNNKPVFFIRLTR